MTDPKIESILDEANRLFLNGRIQDSISYYTRILNQQPDNISALNNKGYALSKLKDYQNAISHYDKALQNNPNDLSVLVNKISALRKQKKLDDALNLCNDVLLQNPSYNILLYHKERILYSMGKYTESIQCCNEILKEYPLNGDVLFDKAQSEAMQSNHSAIDTLSMAISQGKEFAVKAKKSKAFDSLRSDSNFQKLFS